MVNFIDLIYIFVLFRIGHLCFLFLIHSSAYHLQIRQYFELLPDDKVPKFNKTGEEYRAKQLSYQWPKQDLALTYCKHIEPQNYGSYEDFVAGRNEIALDIAYIKDVIAPSICVNCDENMKAGDLAVIAPKFREQVSIQTIEKCQFL